MEVKPTNSEPRDTMATTVQVLLDAIEQLGEELASRDDADLTFRVSVPHDPPAIRILAELINNIGENVEKHLENGEIDMLRRTKELTQAYNAMQEQHEEMRKELEMACRIQERLLPGEQDMPDRPELACAGYYAAMSNVGGDLYDIMRVGKNSYAVLIADVSGHGVPAALITALVKIAFRSRTRWGIGPDEICRQVNAELLPILGDLDYFVTAWFGIINLENGHLSYVNAGHNPSLLLRSDGTILSLDSGGRFLGQFDDGKFQVAEQALHEDDMLLLYTDGIVESRNLVDEEYGFERLQNCLLNSSFSDSASLVEVIHRNLDAFRMGAAQRDDISMLAVDFRHAIAPEKTDPEKPPAATDAHEDPSTIVGGRERLAQDLGREAAILIRADRRQEAAEILGSALILAPGEPVLLLRLAALHIIEKQFGPAQTCLNAIVNPLELSVEMQRQFDRLSGMLKSRKA